jgi:hypothetical protein
MPIIASTVARHSVMSRAGAVACGSSSTRATLQSAHTVIPSTYSDLHNGQYIALTFFPTVHCCFVFY